MAVYKKYNLKRLKPKDKNWALGTWWMEFMLNGNRVHKAIPTAKTKDDATRAENAEREAIYRGMYNKSSSVKRFQEFVETVFIPWAKANKRSWAHDEFRSKYLIEFFGNTKLEHIQPLGIERYKQQRLSTNSQRKRKYSPSSVNRDLQLLSKIFSMAIDNGIVSVNPVSRVRKFREGEGRERFLTYNEEKRLLAQLVGSKVYLRPVIIIAIHTGLRKSELLSLKFEHCNLTDKEVFYGLSGRDVIIPPNHLLVEKSKNGKARTVPINSTVKAELELLRQDAPEKEFVFTSHRTGVNYQEIKKGFKKACEDAGIPHGQMTAGGLTFHDLRHTFATRLREAGVHEIDICQLMGHSSIKMTRRYAHGQSDQMFSAVEKLVEKRGEVIKFKRKTA